MVYFVLFYFILIDITVLEIMNYIKILGVFYFRHVANYINWHTENVCNWTIIEFKVRFISPQKACSYDMER